MTVNNYIDVYTDYLISSSKLSTSTGLSEVLDGAISHDKLTRFLSNNSYDSKTLWQYVKPMVEEIISSDDKVVLAIDDSIEEKRHTRANELICWHYDHSKGRTVKGVNFLSALINTKEIAFPVAVELIKKEKEVINIKTGKKQRKSSVTKNTLFQNIVTTCDKNLWFDYVTADSWFSSSKNIKHIKAIGRDFIIALKANRLAQIIGQKHQKESKWINIKSLQLEQGTALKIRLKGVDFPLLLIKQVFKNGDDTIGELYLVCSDLNLSFWKISALYKRRWCVEEYHKSIKNNSSFGKSPTKIVKTQSNHFHLSIIAFVKLEVLKIRYSSNHFALKNKIYIKAVKAAMSELEKLSTIEHGIAA